MACDESERAIPVCCGEPISTSSVSVSVQLAQKLPLSAASGETASDENDCQSFSDDTNNSFAPIGETDKSGPSWTYTAQPDEAVDLCTKERRLYCFGGEFWLDGA